MRKGFMVPFAATACVISLLLAGCGKNNVFSFAHSAGGNSSTSALSSDALTALRNKDYAKALEYYTKILESDPANSEAIYGYSSATLADAGLDVASLISNLIKENAGAPSHLAPAIDAAALAPANSTNLLPQTIIDNLPRIKAAIDKILATGKLPSIIKGSADGKIEPDNADVSINLAFALVLRAALKVQNSGAITFDRNYNVTINGVAADYKLVALDAGKDIVSAYQRLILVYAKLHLGSDASLAKIKDDIHSLYVDLSNKFGITTAELDINHDYLLD